MITKPVKRLCCLLMVTVLLKVHLEAQDSMRIVAMPVFIHGNFFYDFPRSTGFAGGVDLPLQSKLKTITHQNGRQTVKHRDLIVAGDLGFYHYAFNNSGLYFISSIGKRFYKLRPYYFEMRANIGLLRTFYDGRVYTVDDNGNVKEKKNFGRYYAVTGLSFVFGHDFERSKKPRPIAIDIKPSLWLQYPYNSYALPHLSVELGLKYHFQRFYIHSKLQQSTRHSHK
jgi:hypothetical protein